MTKIFQLYIILIISVVLLNASSNLNDKKLKQKLKHAKPNYKLACSHFEKDFHPHVEKRLFIPIMKRNQFASLPSISNIYDKFLQQCSNEKLHGKVQNELVELSWKYQFFESPHCIRVVLDLGNITKLKNSLDYGYYMFSYREFGKPNIHLKRQEINESINSLTLHRVHIRPYVVCVSFYKNNPELINELNTTDEISSCSDLANQLTNDKRVHDVDLCVDIDTQAHFLSAINSHVPHHGIDGELIMVLFILCLLVFILSSITFAHHLIHKPRVIRNFFRLKSKSYTNNNSSVNQSNIGSHNSLSKQKTGSREVGPTITISDYTQMNQSNTQLQDKNDEPKETDSLLPQNQNAQQTQQSPIDTILSKPADYAPAFVPVITNDKVMFHIGETIYEESPSPSHAKIVDESNNTKTTDEENEECLKTISHLLDDKPWSSSQAQLDISRRQSRSNSVFNTANTVNTNTNANANHVHFELPNE